MINPIIIIPARVASTRLPLKPLADLGGKPMVVRVLERGLEADIGPVIVACDDPQVAQVVQDAGGKVCLTDPKLPSGSDRVYAALTQIDPNSYHDIIINLQGDSPTTEPFLIQSCLKILTDSHYDISTVAVKSTNILQANNPHLCKIALMGLESDPIRQALFFSRSPIPYEASTFYLHIGLYGYRRQALTQYVKHIPSYLEQIERLEQLRALEINLKIGVSLVNTIPQEVNTPEDLSLVQAYFEQLNLISA